MAPGTCLTCAATPLLPLPPTPAGHFTALPVPTVSFHSGENADSELVKPFVVPLPSERNTGRILASSHPKVDQLVILPRSVSYTHLTLPTILRV